MTSSSGAEDASVMLRRRDKRRHLSTVAIDLRDPYSLLSLAVRFDESSHDESLLQVPLETGSIYNQKSFTKALQSLQRVTTPLRPAYKILTGSSSDDTTINFPTSSASVALTPIILSGLLATIHDLQNNNNTNNEGGDDDNNNHIHNNKKNNKKDTPATTTTKKASSEETATVPSSSELVAYCQSMRQAALARIRLRKQRRRIRRTVTPALILLGVVVLCYSTLSNLKQTLIEFDFVDSCNTTACRLHSVSVWELLYVTDVLKECTFESCSMVEGYTEYPVYALHTDARVETIPLDQVGDAKQQRRRRQQQQKRHHSNNNKYHHYKRMAGQLSPLQWLGETTVNRLAREAIQSSRSSSATTTTTTPLKLLDVGCGIGGTLYSILNPATSDKFIYHGIANAAPEIHEAKRLLDVHQLTELSKNNHNNMVIDFRQKDFDEPLEETYNAMVAIESLSYSQDLTATLTNLAASLQSKGVLVIVDDVVSPWASKERIEQLKDVTARPSLRTHKEWQAALNSAGLQVKSVRDLGLEMEFPELFTPVGGSSWEFLSTWRYRTAEFVLERWPQYRDGATSEQKASFRTVQLVQDLVQKARGTAQRQAAFLNADVLYQIYVVEKQ